MAKIQTSNKAAADLNTEMIYMCAWHVLKEFVCKASGGDVTQLRPPMPKHGLTNLSKPFSVTRHPLIEIGEHRKGIAGTIAGTIAGNIANLSGGA